MADIVTLNKDNFEEEVLKSKVPTLVDFWTSWCKPCLAMSPILEDLADEMDGKVKIAKLQTEEPAHQQIASKYDVQSIPNMQLFKNGRVIARFVGARPKEIIKEQIMEVLEKK